MLPVLSSCSFDKPSAPSWEVEVTIPLISKKYMMTELVEDQDVIATDSTGLLSFEESVDIDRFFVGDELKLDGQQESFSQSLGSITIDSPGSAQTGVELREIFSQADVLNGQTTVVAPFSFSTSKKPLDPYGSFAYVIIESGLIGITIDNNLPIPLGSPIVIQIWDTVQDLLVSSTTYGQQIPPGQTAKFDIDLAGKRIPNQLSIRLLADSPGSNGTPVLIDAGSSFSMIASIGDLEVSEAQAEIPEQTVSEEDFVSITDSLIVHEADVESGQIQISLNGTIPLDAWVRYELPDFQTATGAAFVDSFFVARNTSTNKLIDLTGMTLKPTLADFGQQSVRFRWRIRTVGTGTTKVVVKSTDFMNASVNISSIAFASVTGQMGSQKVDISQDDIQIDIPADLDSIFFETATMELVLQNAINFPAQVKLTIEGENDAGVTSVLMVDDVLQPAATPGQPVTTTIVLDQSNSNIDEFISIVPSVIRVNGTVRLGNSSWVGTITRNDFVEGLVNMSAPLSVRLSDQTVETDVARLEIDENVREDIIDNLSKGMFYVELENHLPLGATVELLFCDKDSNLYQQPVLQVGPIGAEAAAVDGSGYVGVAQQSKIVLELSEDQMRTFLFDPLYSGIRILVYGTNGKYVRIRNTDFLGVKSYSKIKVNVNQD